MSKTTSAETKALVLEAFDTLFNKRDYASAERFWSDGYIQHSAHIAPGRDGLFNLIRMLPDTLKYENHLVVADGDHVIAHGRFSGNGRPVAWIADEVVDANPGLDAVELDITDPKSIDTVAARLIADYPDLNVLINNAGIMLPDRAAGPIDDKLLVDTVTTNLLGPIRLTSALVDHLKGRKNAVIAYTSSVLGFVPMAPTAVYSATKAALHSFALSQRFLLKDAGIGVLEIA